MRLISGELTGLIDLIENIGNVNIQMCAVQICISQLLWNTNKQTFYSFEVEPSLKWYYAASLLFCTPNTNTEVGT